MLDCEEVLLGGLRLGGLLLVVGAHHHRELVLFRLILLLIVLSEFLLESDLVGLLLLVLLLSFPGLFGDIFELLLALLKLSFVLFQLVLHVFILQVLHQFSILHLLHVLDGFQLRFDLVDFLVLVRNFVF